MRPLVRNVLAIFAGYAAGYAVNMSIILSSGLVVAPPPGADMMTAEGIRAAIPLMTPMHFLMPFLAHALGTFVGGLVAALVAASHKMKFALAVGVLFLALGTVMIAMVGGPAWFVVLDLVVAFVPMAWLGGRIGSSMSGGTGGVRTGEAVA